MTLNIEASRKQNVIYGDVLDNEGNTVSFTIYNEEGKIILCVSGVGKISKKVYHMFSEFLRKYGEAKTATITFPSVEDAGSKRLKGNVWLCSKWTLKGNVTVNDTLNAIYSFCKAKH